MNFSKWLRHNSEHYLLVDAQRAMAAKHNLNAPIAPKGAKERFWQQIFAPVYRVLPWSLRSRIIQSLPGSHRKDWPGREESHHPAI